MNLLDNNSENPQQRDRPAFPYAGQFLLLWGMLLFFLAVSGTIAALIVNALYDIPIDELQQIYEIESPVPFYILLAVQALGTFIVPAMLLPLIAKQKFQQYYKLKGGLDWKLVLMIIPMIYFILPLIAYSIEINALLPLPEGIQTFFKSLSEDANMGYQKLLSINSVSQAVGILFLAAVLPAIGEELIFRGGFQNILVQWTGKKHLAIWLAAFIFSAWHLQFDMLLPRLLLGAFFGYIYFWTGNILYPIVGHFMNNAIVVLAAYVLTRQGEEITVGEMEGVGFPFSIIFVGLFFVFTFLFRQLALNKIKFSGFSGFK